MQSQDNTGNKPSGFVSAAIIMKVSKRLPVIFNMSICLHISTQKLVNTF